MRLPPSLSFRCALSFLAIALNLLPSANRAAAAEPLTERQYLSGHGPKDAVPWEFSVTSGRRAGEWSTIPVPSQWEQHGFGSYNYGQEPTPASDEHGLYRLRFAVPDAWKGRRIRLVFEGAMTDATVKVNGSPAGPTHIGAFYRFHYDITSLVKPGASPDNLLEVDVAKVSSNPDTNAAERHADYWVFGGIFRPVWLEAAPLQSIDHTAIDARADGTFTADVSLSSTQEATQIDAQILAADGSPAGPAFSSPVAADSTQPIRLSAKIDAPRRWTAETPHLYSLRLTLRKGTDSLHSTTTRFGFRTFEVRAGKGLFLNGQRILLKGVNRHSFRPDTARSLNPEDCYADARLIKAMNMNSVRMSHYPPDEAFLEACDELGLYVLDELSGWHHAHDTDIGRQLVRAMVERDVNHPSILLWDNGNEGGWNTALDGEFALHDPQKRNVLHPWELHGDIDTKHYPAYDDLSKRLRGPNLLLPTEFVHALYDGGAGAGLQDYWAAIVKSPFGAGGFIWALADEGIARTDRAGRIDVFSTYAPDGIVGPRHEKEASYHTVRDLWSPVLVEPPVLDDQFKGKLTVHNRYDFTSLAQCRFTWQLVRHRNPADKDTTPIVILKGDASPPPIAPQTSGQLDLALPANWIEKEADALVLTAFGPGQNEPGSAGLQPGTSGPVLKASGPERNELWTWSWSTIDLAKRLVAPPSQLTALEPKVETGTDDYLLVVGDVTASFDASTGLLRTLRRGEKTAALSRGPRLVFQRPASAGPLAWIPFAAEDAATQIRRLRTPQLANTIEVDLAYEKTTAYAGFKLEISTDGQSWKTLFDATRRPVDGKLFNFPPQPVRDVRISNLHDSAGQPIALNSVRLGYAAGRFPAASKTSPTITTGTGLDPQNGEAIAWLESHDTGALKSFRWTLRHDRSLRLDYTYELAGDLHYHGITFDHPEEKINSLRWLGEGPYRVWQNRLRGTWLGIHDIARGDPQPGETWNYPEFQGFFAGLRWARLDTAAGPLTITSASPEIFLRVGTPRISHQNTTVDFPAGDLSFLYAIPAIGSKFVTPEKSGPASQSARASDSYTGTLVFRLGD